MPWLLFSYSALLGTACVILGLVLSLLLYRIRNKRQHTWWLFMLFGCMTVMMSVFTLLVSVNHPWALYGIGSIVLIDLSILCLLQFGYTFPNNARPKEANIVLWISLLVALASAVALISMSRFDLMGYTLVPELWVAFALIFQLVRMVEILWLGFVFVRKLNFLENDPTRSLIAKVLFPRRPGSRTIRAFLFSFSIGLMMPVAIVLEYTALIDQNASAQIFMVTVLILFATFFVAYINHQPEESSFMMKLVGVSLVIVLLTLAVVGNLAARQAGEAYHQQRLRDVALCRTLIEEDRRDRIPTDVLYVIHKPLTGSSHYSVWYQADPAFHPGRLEEMDHRLAQRMNEVHKLANRIFPFITTDLEARDAVQELQPMERITDIQGLVIAGRDLHYDFIHNGHLYQVGFSYVDYRRHMHQTNGNMVMIMLVVSLVILLFFPSFLERGVTRPIGALMHTVHRVNQGDLHARVPIFARDEVGFVAEAFNKMVAGIAEARQKAVDQEREQVRLAAENERKTRELEKARYLQLSMLPDHVPAIEGLTLAAFTNPASEVGGDYYDFYTDAQNLTVVVGDATGHGLQAGTMVAATKALFNVLAPDHEPVPLLEDMSRALSRMGFHNMFMALLIVRLQGDQLTMTAAGMPYALHYHAATGAVDRIVIKGLPLGSGLPFPYQQVQRTFEPGDALFLCSDGLEERFNPQDDMLGSDRVLARFTELVERPPAQIIGQLVVLGENWADGRPQDDDVTLLVIRRATTEEPA